MNLHQSGHGDVTMTKPSISLSSLCMYLCVLDLQTDGQSVQPCKFIFRVSALWIDDAVPNNDGAFVNLVFLNLSAIISVGGLEEFCVHVHDDLLRYCSIHPVVKRITPLVHVFTECAARNVTSQGYRFSLPVIHSTHTCTHSLVC